MSVHNNPNPNYSGHAIPWSEFKEFVDELFLTPTPLAMTGNDLSDAHSRSTSRKKISNAYSQLLRKNRNASIFGDYSMSMGSDETGTGASLSDSFGHFKVPNKVMTQAITKSVHSYRHKFLNDNLTSSLPELTYNKSKLPVKNTITREDDPDHVDLCASHRLSCSGGKKQRRFVISYLGTARVVREPGKIRDQDFSETLRCNSPSLVDRLGKDDFLRRYNERGDSRIYRVKYEPEDERRETPFDHVELPERRQDLNSNAFSVSRNHKFVASSSRVITHC